MVVQRRLWLTANVREHIQEEHLNVTQTVRVTSELRVVPAYISLFTRDLLGQQVGFVEKQYYGYALEVDVVRDRVEYIERFLQTICFPGINQNVIDYFNVYSG